MPEATMAMHRLQSNFALKLAGDSIDTMTFSGYGAYFGNVDSHGDVIAKGAFKKTLSAIKKSGNWPPMLLQHGGWGMGTEDMMPVGIWTEMAEDDNGLYIKGRLADTDRGRETYGLLKMEPRPAITGLSIGYQAVDVSFGTKPDEPRRTIKQIDLFEISLVTFPANDRARVDAVKAAQNIKTIREFEGFLRDAGGYSHAEARRLASQGFKSADESRDEMDGAEQDLVTALSALTATIKP